MVIKDQHCLESIIEAIERIIEYTSCLKIFAASYEEPERSAAQRS